MLWSYSLHSIWYCRLDHGDCKLKYLKVTEGQFFLDRIWIRPLNVPFIVYILYAIIECFNECFYHAPKHPVDYVFVLLESKGLNNWTPGNKHTVSETDISWDKLEKAIHCLECRIDLRISEGSSQSTDTVQLHRNYAVFMFLGTRIVTIVGRYLKIGHILWCLSYSQFKFKAQFYSTFHMPISIHRFFSSKNIDSTKCLLTMKGDPKCFCWGWIWELKP